MLSEEYNRANQKLVSGEKMVTSEIVRRTFLEGNNKQVVKKVKIRKAIRR